MTEEDVERQNEELFSLRPQSSHHHHNSSASDQPAKRQPMQQQQQQILRIPDTPDAAADADSSASSTSSEDELEEGPSIVPSTRSAFHFPDCLLVSNPQNVLRGGGEEAAPDEPADPASVVLKTNALTLDELFQNEEYAEGLDIQTQHIPSLSLDRYKQGHPVHIV